MNSGLARVGQMPDLTLCSSSSQRLAWVGSLSMGLPQKIPEYNLHLCVLSSCRQWRWRGHWAGGDHEPLPVTAHPTTAPGHRTERL